MFEITQLSVDVHRVPVAMPVRTAFGMMLDRPLVLIALKDQDGTCGYGEVWCNFPSCGAEHRARLIETEITPLILHQEINHPSEVFAKLTNCLHLLVNQTGEEGPVAQAIAGIDIALWDLHARRTAQPLWQALGGSEERRSVPAYASGINPEEPERMAASKYDSGYRAFKLKVGFDDALDVANARAIRNALGADVKLMVDANQGWDLERALRMVDLLAEFDLTWVEEALPVDAAQNDWQTLADASPIPLAGGENLRGRRAFQNAIDSGIFKFIQPDVAKWGGLSGCLAVAKDIRDAGLTYCPHWLGGGVGLLASAHLLAATGGNGLLEVDSNPNPLRDELLTPWSFERDGTWTLGTEPGLGANPAMGYTTT